MSEQGARPPNNGQKQYNISSQIIVNAYIHQIEVLLNKQQSQTIPVDIYQLCTDFYVIPKLLFIKYESNPSRSGEIRFGIINTNKQYISNEIILNLPDDHQIVKESLCYIQNISNHVFNLNPHIIKSMNMDFKNILYDGFFCIISKITYSTMYLTHIQHWFPCLIFYESKHIYNTYCNVANNAYGIDAKILISKREISDNEIDPATAFKIDSSPRIICHAPNGNQLYQLKLHNVRSDAFEFKQIFSKPPFTGHIFVEQPEVEYEEVLDALLNDNCCVGVYDDNAKRWRSGVYMYHWDKTKRIMIQYVDNDLISVGKDRFKTIQYFPAKNVWIDNEKFVVTASNLRISSHLSKDSINKWKQKNQINQSYLKKYWIQPPDLNVDEKDMFKWIKYYILLHIKHWHCCDDKNLISVSKEGNIGMPLIYNHKLNTAFLTHSEKNLIELMSKEDRTTKILWFDGDLLNCAHLSRNGRNSVCFYYLDTKSDEYKWISLYQMNIDDDISFETLFD